MDRSVAPAAYFIARINHESKNFLRQNLPIFEVRVGERTALQGREKESWKKPFLAPQARVPDTRFAWWGEDPRAAKRSAKEQFLPYKDNERQGNDDGAMSTDNPSAVGAT